MHDLGTVLIEKALRDLQLDGNPFVREPRGFTFCRSRLATRVWADPEVDDDGIRVTRLHAVTDLVRGVPDDAATNSAIAALGRHRAGASAIVRGEDSSRLKLHSSVNANEESGAGAAWLFKLVVALQADEASRAAAALVSEVGGEADETGHPRPSRPYDILRVCRSIVRERAGSPCRWAGEEMLALLEAFQEPPCLLASGDENGLAAEFPFLGRSSLLRFITDAGHPILGHGLLVLLSIPAGDSAKERGDLAMRLNRLEVEQHVRTHLLGSWTDVEGTVTYVSFLPNGLHLPGLLWNLGIGLALRANWAAEKVFGDDWGRNPGESAVARLARLGAARPRSRVSPVVN